MKQTTLNQSFVLEGKGLHSGELSRVQVGPGDIDSGYRLKVGKHTVLIAPWRLDSRHHCTSVTVAPDLEILTVEHLLAALYGMGVDNATVEVLQGGEIPGLDGSSLPIAQKIAEVGIVEQSAEARYYQLTHDVAAGAYGCCLSATPIKERELRVTYYLEYPDCPPACGMVTKVITPDVFLKEIAPARTFVMQREIESLQKSGLGKGANTQNTLVFNGSDVVNNSMRVADEPMAHKILDLVGDLATCGRRLGAHLIAHKSGHALNHKLTQEIRLKALGREHPGGVLNIKQIEKMLPHRYPFLLVDRVLELEPFAYVRAYKNLTRNEEFFNGHFPGTPMMPGVLQIEAMAQAGILGTLFDNQKMLAVLTGVEETKYRRPVVPGDRLDISGYVLKYNGRVGSMAAKTTVDGELACSTVLKFAFINAETGTVV
ncbi:bifunctional enzyme LpxC/FabZ [Planctomycetales bacterium]|nr:bifunctional enzyme LpxC/FabZ [Planctomycetales bacterium]GHT02859.1 bifunctional enzyme LpxC/FabZ [Planctomycetales bacterium]GHV23648.1 bifunctional enzyme LpxC/FabZ [Planctomycetales bacterium]